MSEKYHNSYIQDDNPGAKIVFGDFMKECGEKWRAIDPEDKKPFEKKAKADAARHVREMDNYEPEDEPAKKKKKKKVIYTNFGAKAKYISILFELSSATLGIF